MDSRSVAIRPPRREAGGRTIQRRFARPAAPPHGRSSQQGLITMPDLGDHDADLADHDADLGDHDGPI